MHAITPSQSDSRYVTDRQAIMNIILNVIGSIVKVKIVIRNIIRFVVGAATRPVEAQLSDEACIALKAHTGALVP
jgi:hypothetical protein